ncbi:flagellar biosynthesis protein FlhF [Methylotenera oryzisoli]|uniref:Flagellar biosynthesis protein FlhF n=1 Tax=Methylotenera oryzisoli TaxID=2080758 RepID=A0A4Y9VVR4_9PROT|nr:flagellar biosynthesis protein FlhF [Methylotenera oryzisoli]TFW73185.1 flagellar biosynthesis protein FlhF [Methylotenera oryzisoli]
MNIRRFFGKSSREALTIVRQELGDDAVILSNRAVAGGNEIMAFREVEMNAMVNATPAHTTSELSDATPWLSLLNKNASEQQQSVTADSMDNTIKTSNPRQTPLNHDVDAHNNLQANKSNAATSKQMVWMLKEMRSMRNVIESQLATIAWGNIQQRDPIKSEVLSGLLGARFSPALSRYLAEKLPSNLDSKKAQAWVKYILSKNLNTIENEAEILDQGGVFALIGPTGVGKTTTTAKLAARYVMKHGTQNLGLITTDAYRVGGHEQLRIYGKILGVVVYAVKDETDLALALNELKNKHTILIDTVGVSQRDRMVTEQIALLSSSKATIKKLLCLNATNTGETLTDVISAYKGKGLDGCIITKLDEAVTIGNTLDVIIREKLKLYYTANGQRVPEDINLANKIALIELALYSKSPANRPFEFLEEELPFVMGKTYNSDHISQLAEI